jgi:glycosyltransferase involved in cell wall biosynthesis
VPRRLLILNTDLKVGGTPTVVREIATRLHDARRVHVHVACLGPSGPVAEQICGRGVAVTALNGRGMRDIWAVRRRLVELIRRRGIDTVFSFLMHANAVAAMARPACGAGVRFIQSIQTTQPHPWWHWRVQAVAQRAAEQIIVPSASVARAARERARVPPSKTVVIPNAIDPTAFEISPVPQRDPRPYPIGFVGRLDPIKRVPVLVEATALLGDLVHLHIFGDGPDRPAIERAIVASCAAGRVTLHGMVDGPAVAMRQIGCLVLASISEGMPMVVIEAMAAGVPVVGADVPGIGELIVDGENGVLVPASAKPRELAEGIRRVVEDRGLRERIVGQAGRWVRERFTWDRVVERYREVLLGGNDKCNDK